MAVNVNLVQAQFGMAKPWANPEARGGMLLYREKVEAGRAVLNKKPIGGNWESEV